MTKVTLYRYEREPGKITISPIAPAEGIEFDNMYRLIADEGMELVKEDVRTCCVDIEIEDIDNWHEEPVIEEVE